MILLHSTLDNKLKILFETLKDHGKTLCVAESCTGGLLSSIIVDYPGASLIFKGGIVSYANKIKNELLNVPMALLETKGAVNQETAILMAKGVRSLLKADWSLSITGLMGPDSDFSRQAIGQVFVGVCNSDSHFASGVIISGGDRMERKKKSAYYGLDFLISRMLVSR